MSLSGLLPKVALFSQFHSAAPPQPPKRSACKQSSSHRRGPFAARARTINLRRRPTKVGQETQRHVVLTAAARRSLRLGVVRTCGKRKSLVTPFYFFEGAGKSVVTPFYFRRGR